MTLWYVSKGQLMCELSTGPFSFTASNAWDCVLEAVRSRIPILTSPSTSYSSFPTFLSQNIDGEKVLGRQCEAHPSQPQPCLTPRCRRRSMHFHPINLRSSLLRNREEIRTLTTNTWIKAFGIADTGIRKKIASRTPDSTTATEGLSGDVNSMHASLIKE
jgi:hypothetical protein